MSTEKLLEARRITKVYPNGVLANKDVNFSLRVGEIHALAGENGAGKSTLMKILFGMEQPSEGEILLRGKPIRLSSPQDAIAHGLGMVHQHFMLVPSFTVTQNIVLGVEPKKGLRINYDEAVKRVNEISQKYNLIVDAEQKVEDLSVGMKQKVEILKALYRGAKILILDEPTAVLTPQETTEFFAQLKRLKDDGFTIVFISHKLKEIKEICDRITIMRAGRDVGVYNVADVTEQEISRLMVGRDVLLKYEKPTVRAERRVLEISHLTCVGESGKEILRDITLSVHSGEILGVAGVDGNGQNQLVSAIMGELRPQSGHISVNGSSTSGMNIRHIRDLGVAYIPEDRIKQGSAGDASIEDNLIANRYDTEEVGNGKVLNGGRIRTLAKRLIEEYSILCKNSEQPVGMLSGGNMQKVVVARECSLSPTLLIAEQPTRGVDVGATQIIHQNLLRLRKQNTAILLVSADLNEAVKLSDHLIVMFEGQIAAYFEHPSEVGEERLGLAMLGLEIMPPEEIRRAFYANEQAV